MYITLRRGQIATDQVAATLFAVEIAELVEQTVGNTISVWSSLYGMPLGTLSWSSQVDGLAHAQTQTTKLMENPEYLARVAEAGEQGLFIPGSFEDGIARVVHVAGEQGHVEYVSTTMGTIAPGQAAGAMAFATEVADLVAEVAATPVTVCTSNYGAALGSLMFFVGYSGADGVDAAQDALMSSAEYQAMMIAAADLFLPDGQRTLAQRLR